ncbi:hypothetical protein AZE42_10021 [Rhizopogon vesiculosus]|uniref:G patch domain-containing protein n=1 Tax=Rhizopogon vesiculosus TaxID=180088 RepID=A0A1J8QI41_9AGAM|nr:hypothetical protein AZE42_10021 [Rhizopogon vesiculosus]
MSFYDYTTPDNRTANYFMPASERSHEDETLFIPNHNDAFNFHSTFLSLDSEETSLLDPEETKWLIDSTATCDSYLRLYQCQELKIRIGDTKLWKLQCPFAEKHWGSGSCSSKQSLQKSVKGTVRSTRTTLITAFLYSSDSHHRTNSILQFGAPLPPFEKSKDTGEFVPIWKQEENDEKGRRRLHDAFTGGFSAGYFNSMLPRKDDFHGLGYGPGLGLHASLGVAPEASKQPSGPCLAGACSRHCYSMRTFDSDPLTPEGFGLGALNGADEDDVDVNDHTQTHGRNRHAYNASDVCEHMAHGVWGSQCELIYEF